MFDRNRNYANGTQDTSIYKQILTSLDPNNGDGSFLNMDFPCPHPPEVREDCGKQESFLLSRILLLKLSIHYIKQEKDLAEGKINSTIKTRPS